MSPAVAHVKEEGSEKWWRFDDEAVTLLPDGPMGCSTDLGVAAEKKASLPVFLPFQMQNIEQGRMFGFAAVWRQALEACTACQQNPGVE